MDAWFENTVTGRYVAEKECAFFRQYCDSRAGTVIRHGGRWIMPSENLIGVPADVEMSDSRMAWADGSADMLLLAHRHETAEGMQVLQEACRVLKPGGRLLLTGFNPHSLWRFSAWFDGNILPYREYCLPLPVLKQRLQTLGLRVEYGKFMVYVPAVGNEKALKFWQFLEKAGDRWWPQCAAVYGLVLVKTAVELKFLHEEQYAGDGMVVALSAAKVAESRTGRLNELA